MNQALLIIIIILCVGCESQSSSLEYASTENSQNEEGSPSRTGVTSSLLQAQPQGIDEEKIYYVLFVILVDVEFDPNSLEGKQYMQSLGAGPGRVVRSLINHSWSSVQCSQYLEDCRQEALEMSPFRDKKNVLLSIMFDDHVESNL